jgi:hypothetical protein
MVYDIHLPLSNGSGSCSRCNRKLASAAIPLYQHWQISPVAFGKRKVRHNNSLLSITPRSSHSTFNQQETGKGEKLILLVREFWKPASRNYKLASVTTSHTPKER